MILRAEGAGWDVAGRTILSHVDVSVAGGEIVGLIGPNGAGKSTLLRMLAGLLRPTRGRILLDGADLSTLNRRSIAQRLAFVEQAATSDQDPTVADVLELGRTPHRRLWASSSRRDREIVERIAYETDLAGLLGARYSTLSGGERQRVQIARGFVQEPELLLLDEPTNHLDIKYQLGLLDLVTRHVRQTAAAAVIAVHDLNLAAMYCDRIVVLSDDGVVSEGSPEATITEQMMSEVFDVDARVGQDDGVWVRLRPAHDAPPPVSGA